MRLRNVPVKCAFFRFFGARRDRFTDAAGVVCGRSGRAGSTRLPAFSAQQLPLRFGALHALFMDKGQLSDPVYWRQGHADHAAVIIDAARYFEVAREALLKARRRIMLIGWDFDARIELGGDDLLPEEPRAIGDFLYWLVERNPDLELYLLRWDTGALKTLLRGATLLTILKWTRHPRIHLRLDSHHPLGASHHQKLVTIDDCMAFCGGIDMTLDRWDTRDHSDDDPGRVNPSGKTYLPWHDATSALCGPAAGALAELARYRWKRATGVDLVAVEAQAPCWPDSLHPDFSDLDVGIARTFPQMPDESPVLEVERLFVEQIGLAERHIYIESQYFASRAVAEAIARRLDEADGPEVVIINPETAEGWLQSVAMDSARARLMRALYRRDRYGRLAMYHPFTERGDPIYVHAKITIIDDRQVRIGSANINNRSLRLDTECDVCFDAAAAGGGDHVAATVRDIRNGLIAEHLGVATALVATKIEQTGSLKATIEALRSAGRSLRPYTVPDIPAVETWLADNEVLDPEGPGEMFEPLSERGLFRGRLFRRKN